VSVEVRDGHLARKQKGHGPGEQPDEKQQPSDRLEDSGDAGQGTNGGGPPPGMIAAGSANHLAVPNCKKRKAATILSVLSRWQRMRSFSTGGTYINFLTEEEGDARIRAAYGANYERLVSLKSTWDPGNLFRANKNLAPRQRR
jgi:hypothetical protein